MSKELKITRGEVRRNEATFSRAYREYVVNEDIETVCECYGDTREEAEANADLTTETFNIANECGLTPRQLMEQRDEALETLKMAQNVLRMASLIDKSNTCEKAEVEVTATINKLSK